MSAHNVSSLSSGRLKELLDGLYADAVRTDPQVRAKAHSSGIYQETDPRFYAMMSQAYMPVTPQFGRLLYLMARARGAENILEFGTSFGISTIFLAAGVRDNGGGKVISTEIDPEKAARAIANIRQAGLEQYVEIRLGDAQHTLAANLPDQIQMLFLDGPKKMYLSILKIAETHLPSAALIASDNSEMQGLGDFLSYVRHPDNGYECASFFTEALNNSYGHEIVMRR